MIDDKKERISILLFKCITGNITEEEQQMVDHWRQENEANERLYSRLMDTCYLEKEYHRRKMMNIQRPMEDMQKRIKERAPRNFSIQWKPLVAAASVALLFCIGFVRFQINSSDNRKANNVQQTLALADIKPGTRQATLTLTDGKKVQLGEDSQINLQTLGKHQSLAQAVSNLKQLSLEVPRGGEFKVVLEDSTEVWLNSESKLIYPESFAQNERRVIVKGEAYFKVTKDPKRPFYVETDGQQVRVYGTEFNIRSYAEDKQVYTTLIEGSIALSKLNEKSGELLLTPGHQALFDKREATTFVQSVDTAVVTSWKKGRFVFEGQNLEQIMCDLSRWYNFDYKFKEESLRRIEFMGSIPRYNDFPSTLALLKKSGGIEFHLEGSTVIISQEKKPEH